MSEPAKLFAEFSDALNAEIASLDCNLRIGRKAPGPGDTLILLDANGFELGLVPEHIDASSIAAIEVILKRRLRRP